MTDVSEKPVAWAIRSPCGLQYFDSEAVARTALESNQRLRRRDWPPTGKVIPLYTRPADEALVCIGEVVELDDGIGTKIIDYTDARKDLPVGTKIYAPMQKEPGRE